MPVMSARSVCNVKIKLYKVLLHALRQCVPLLPEIHQGIKIKMSDNQVKVFDDHVVGKQGKDILVNNVLVNTKDGLFMNVEHVVIGVVFMKDWVWVYTSDGQFVELEQKAKKFFLDYLHSRRDAFTKRMDSNDLCGSDINEEKLASISDSDTFTVQFRKCAVVAVDTLLLTHPRDPRSAHVLHLSNGETHAVLSKKNASDFLQDIFGLDGGTGCLKCHGPFLNPTCENVDLGKKGHWVTCIRQGLVHSVESSQHELGLAGVRFARCQLATAGEDEFNLVLTCHGTWPIRVGRPDRPANCKSSLLDTMAPRKHARPTARTAQQDDIMRAESGVILKRKGIISVAVHKSGMIEVTTGAICTAHLKNVDVSVAFSEPEYTCDFICLGDDPESTNRRFRKSAIVAIHSYMGNCDKPFHVLLLENGTKQPVVSDLNARDIIPHVFEDLPIVGPCVNTSFHLMPSEGTSAFSKYDQWLTTIRASAVESWRDNSVKKCNSEHGNHLTQFMFANVWVVPGNFNMDLAIQTETTKTSYMCGGQ